MRNLLLQGHALRIKECWDNLSKIHGNLVPRHDAQKDRGLCGSHDCQILKRGQARCKPHKALQETKEVPTQVKSDKLHI